MQYVLGFVNKIHGSITRVVLKFNIKNQSSVLNLETSWQLAQWMKWPSLIFCMKSIIISEYLLYIQSCRLKSSLDSWHLCL